MCATQRVTFTVSSQLWEGQELDRHQSAACEQKPFLNTRLCEAQIPRFGNQALIFWSLAIKLPKGGTCPSGVFCAVSLFPPKQASH